MVCFIRSYLIRVIGKDVAKISTNKLSTLVFDFTFISLHVSGARQNDPKPAELRPAAAALRGTCGGVTAAGLRGSKKMLYPTSVSS